MKTKIKPISLSVFFPAYNEEENIGIVLNNAVSVISKITSDYEIIVVDDGSKDKTSGIVKGFCKRNHKIRLIKHIKNKGYGAALKTGFENSIKNLIFYTDADLQFDLSDINGLLKYINQYDLVVGFRVNRNDPIMRLFAAYVYRLIVRYFLGVNVKDPDCAFKLCRKHVIDMVRPFECARGADAELLVKAKKYGFTIKQVGVKHLPRLRGKSEAATLFNIIKPRIVYLMLKETLKLKKMK